MPTTEYGRTVYRLRKRPTARGKFMSYELGIPQQIADRLIAKGYEMFIVELTTEGILYRPINASPTAEMAVPDWLK